MNSFSLSSLIICDSRLSLIKYSFLDLAYGLPTSEIPPLIPLKKIVLKYDFYSMTYLSMNKCMSGSCGTSSLTLVSNKALSHDKLGALIK